MTHREDAATGKSDASGEPSSRRWPRLRAFDIGCLLFSLIGLVMFLFPILKSAREVAEKVVCEGNVKQIGAALLQYEQDNDGRLPPSDRWTIRLKSDIRDGEAARRLPLHCPSASKTPSGYALNKALGGRSAESFADPSTLVLLFESDSTDPNAIGSSQNVAWGRHYGRVNFGYADGHAKHIMGTPQNPNPDNVSLVWRP